MGKEQKSTVTQELDPRTRQLQGLAINSALRGFGLGGGPNSGQAFQAIPGVSPLTQQAIGTFQHAGAVGNLGLNALGGDPSAIGTLMNPYQANVIDQLKSQYGDLAANTTNAVNDAFTRSGAFGGSRQGVAEGVALSQLNKDLGNQLTGLQYQGYNDALGRAGVAANLGLGAGDALHQLGEYERQVAISQDPQMRRLQIFSGLLGVNPSTTSQTETQHGSLLNGILGAVGTAVGLGFNPFHHAAASPSVPNLGLQPHLSPLSFGMGAGPATMPLLGPIPGYGG